MDRQPPSKADSAGNMNMECMSATSPSKTPVSLLQEYCQKKALSIPKYDDLPLEGDARNTVFAIKVTVEEYTANGSAKTKKKAKHEAAQAVLDMIKSEAAKARGPLRPAATGSLAPAKLLRPAVTGKSGTPPKAAKARGPAATGKNLAPAKLSSRIVSPHNVSIPAKPVGSIEMKINFSNKESDKEEDAVNSLKEVLESKEMDYGDGDCTSILSDHTLLWLSERGLCSKITLEVLSSQGLHSLTHIQYISFPHLINKSDCYLHARTGSGKTLAYLLPAIERLKAMEFKKSFGVGCLVVSPTRELAQQIKKVLEPLAKAHNFTALTMIGGIKESFKDKAVIKSGATIVVATPGRLKDAATRIPGEALPLSKCKILILDEADSILENYQQMEDVKKVYAYLPEDNLQKVLVSATVNEKCIEFGNNVLKADFKMLSTEKEKNQTSTDQIKQNYLLVTSGDRFSMLITVLKTLDTKKVIVFFAAGHSVKFHFQLLQRLGLPVLHCFGRMAQGKRSSTYEQFLQMPSGILLSTGMAERGWDIPGVQWIIQFDPPHNPQDYVHRVGRSGRGEGAKGRALLFVRPQEQEFLTVLKNMNVDIEQLEFQGNLEPIQEQITMTVTKERVLKQFAKIAFKKFVRAYQCHKYKKVFNIKNLELDQVCKDFGFIKPPMQLHLKTLK